MDDDLEEIVQTIDTKRVVGFTYQKPSWPQEVYVGKGFRIILQNVDKVSTIRLYRHSVGNIFVYDELDLETGKHSVGVPIRDGLIMYIIHDD